MVRGPFEAVDDFRGAHRVEVEPRDGVADGRRPNRLTVELDEPVHFEVVEHAVCHLSQSLGVVGLGRIQRLVEEFEQPLAGVGETGGDRREQMRPQGGLGRELRPHVLGVGPDVPLEQFVAGVGVLRQQHRLAVGVEAGPAGATHHLVDFEHVQRLHPAVVAVVALPVADDDAAARGVDAGGERRRRADALDESVAEGVFHERSVLRGESRVVERRTLGDRVGEVLGGLGVGHVAYLGGEFREVAPFVAGDVPLRHVGHAAGRGLRVAPRVHEDERGALVAVAVALQRVGDERGRLSLPAADRHLALAPVGEGDGVAVVDAHLEVDGSPVGLDEFRVEPVGDDARVADGRRERDDLQVRVEPAELRQRDLQRRPPMAVVDEVDLVGDDAGELVHPRRVVSDERVDLLGGGDDDVARGEPLAVGLVVAGRDADVDAVLLPALELGFLLGGERPERDDVQRLPAARDARQHRQFGDERLPARRRDGGHEALAVRQAGLDGLGLRRVQLLDALVAEGLGNPRR